MLYTANVAAESVFNMLVNRGYIRPLAHGAVMVFSMAWSTLLYLNHEAPNDLDNARGIVDTVHGRRFQPDSWDVKLAAMYLQMTRSAPLPVSPRTVPTIEVTPVPPISVTSVSPVVLTNGVVAPSTATTSTPTPTLNTIDGGRHHKKHRLLPVPAWLAVISTQRHRDRARQWLLDSDVAYTLVGAVRGFLLGFALKGGMSLAGKLPCSHVHHSNTFRMRPPFINLSNTEPYKHSCNVFTKEVRSCIMVGCECTSSSSFWCHGICNIRWCTWYCCISEDSSWWCTCMFSSHPLISMRSYGCLIDVVCVCGIIGWME
jgi:hypothetical protein